MRKHRHRWIDSINERLLVCSKKQMGAHGWEPCRALAPKNPGVFYSRYKKFSYTHLCLQSPTALCKYNRDEDPARDDCVYCHQPYERK